jgi:hypothetical protein
LRDGRTFLAMIEMDDYRKMGFPKAGIGNNYY